MSGIYYHRNITFKISVTGILLSISLLFLYISHTLIPWPIFPAIGLKVDLSTLFILPIFMLAGVWLGFVALTIRFVLGPFIVPNLPVNIGYFAHFVFLLASLIFILSFLASDYLLNLTKKEIVITNGDEISSSNDILVKKRNTKKRHIMLILSLIISILATSLIMTLLNGYFITPVFFNLYGLTSAITYADLEPVWTNISHSIKVSNLSYWGFIFTLYFPFNLVNFLITSILAMPLYFVIKTFKKRRGF